VVTTDHHNGDTALSEPLRQEQALSVCNITSVVDIPRYYYEIDLTVLRNILDMAKARLCTAQIKLAEPTQSVEVQIRGV
jgi:hypothetical protein